MTAINGYYVKAAKLKDSKTGDFVGFTPAIYTGDGFIQSSAYVGVTMGANPPLANSGEISMEQYENARLPSRDFLNDCKLPYKSLLRVRP